MRNRVHQGRPCPTKRFNMKVVRCYKHKPMATNTRNTSYKTLQLPGARHQLQPVASVTGGHGVSMQAVLAETDRDSCAQLHALFSLKHTETHPLSASDKQSALITTSHDTCKTLNYFIRGSLGPRPHPLLSCIGGGVWGRNYSAPP